MSRNVEPAVPWPLEESWNHEAGLTRLRNRGWRPRFVYDIGASNGAWTGTAATVFPLAEFHLFEPLADVEPSYRDAISQMSVQPGLRIRVHPVALDMAPGLRKMGISVHPMGSSMLATQTSEFFPRVIEVETTALDLYAEEHDLPAPDMLKIDTQGTELRILAGAERILQSSPLLLIETWLVRGYGQETPLLHEMVAWLAERDFFVADTVGAYREGDKLVAMDLLFAGPRAEIDLSK